MTRKIIICADDYGKSLAISQGIIELIKNNRISATSCMTSMPNFQNFANALKPYLNKIDIGLHFNLTENSLYNLPQLIIATNLHICNKKKIAAEFKRQLDLFIEHFGCAPNFIDGHQHIHQLPIISDIIFSQYQSYFKNSKPYMRYVQMTNNKIAILKQFAITLVSDFSFKQKLMKFSIPFNQSFAGIYDFKKSNRYAKLFPEFLRTLHDGGLLMCHPGKTANDPTDAISNSRYLEYSYLQSSQFIQDLQEANIQIGRFA